MIRTALALFPSVIKSGEPWTEACQKVLEGALKELSELKSIGGPLIFGQKMKVNKDIHDPINLYKYAGKGQTVEVVSDHGGMVKVSHRDWHNYIFSVNREDLY